MKIINITKGLIGSKTAIESGIKGRIPEGKEEEIKFKLKVLDHSKKYGMRSAIDAFNISERTIKYWRARLKNNHGVIAKLANKSTRPFNTRKRIFPLEIINFIKDEKLDRPKLGRDKLSQMLLNEKGYEISPSSVQNIIDDLKKSGELRDGIKLRFGVKTGKQIIIKPFKRKKKQRIGDFKANNPGDIIQIDTIVIFVNGKRFYCLTAIDVYTRLAYAYISHSHTSLNALRFLNKLKDIFPFEIQRVQTDNGSEFHKYFDDACKELNIIHYFNYPHSPKMNAYIERFNRTIQEEHLNRCRNIFILDDLEKLNFHLQIYLDFYNNRRPHWGLHLNTPLCYTREILGVQNVS